MEGPDGAGKSTQIDLLRVYLLQKGYDIIVCREPGGTVISEAIREVILNRDYKNMGHMTELLLYAAARAQLVEEVIQPALDQGKVVICDRFIESSAVYQGIARGLGVDLVYEVNRLAVGNTILDITTASYTYLSLPTSELVYISGLTRPTKKKRQGTSAHF